MQYFKTSFSSQNLPPFHFSLYCYKSGLLFHPALLRRLQLLTTTCQAMICQAVTSQAMVCQAVTCQAMICQAVTGKLWFAKLWHDKIWFDKLWYSDLQSEIPIWLSIAELWWTCQFITHCFKSPLCATDFILTRYGVLYPCTLHLMCFEFMQVCHETCLGRTACNKSTCPLLIKPFTSASRYANQRL